jgi:uncharacterized YccA/Bax inhibitor family protein
VAGSVLLLMLGAALSAGFMAWAFAPGAGWLAMPAGPTARDLALGSGVLAFALAFAAGWRPAWAPRVALPYALASGVFMGGLAVTLEARHPGIALQSVVLAITVAALTLAAYTAGWVRATPRFQAAVYLATAGIALVYLAALVLQLAGVPLPWLGLSGTGAVAWHAFVALTAALNLVVDFSRVEAARNRPQPAHMRWALALGVMVTLVWMYVSVLRLLAAVRR